MSINREIVERPEFASTIMATPDDMDDANTENSNAADPGCPKCGHADTDTGSISVAGTGLSKMFDLQTNPFQVISCTNCGYSEFYRDDASGNLLDLFFG